MLVYACIPMEFFFVYILLSILVLYMQFHTRECTRTVMVVNTLRNPNLALALREPRPYITGVWFVQSSDGVGVVVALERILVTVDYEESVHCPRQTVAVSCKKLSS